MKVGMEGQLHVTNLHNSLSINYHVVYRGEGPFRNSIGESKAPLKADLIKELKELQKRFDTLENKNKSLKNANDGLEDINTNFLEVIKCLKERVDHFEKEKEGFSKQTQTESGIHLKCDECNLEAKNRSELSWHPVKTMGGHMTRSKKNWT